MVLKADLAWIIGGDFNKILFENEKQGGRPRPMAQIQGFRNVLQECHLFEIEHADKSYTWFNKKRVGEAVFERLDRFLVNQPWLRAFPETMTTNLDFFGSDHQPILCRVKRSNDRGEDGFTGRTNGCMMRI